MIDIAEHEPAPWEDGASAVGMTTATTTSPADEWPSWIHPNHRAEFEASGLTAATIRAAEIRSEHDRSILADWVGRKTWPASYRSAWAVPYFDDTGAVAFRRVKPDNTPKGRDGRPQKYLHPRGAIVRAYIPPTLNGELAECHKPLLITEGEKKALSAVQHGFCCIGLMGVACWCILKTTALLPQLERLPVKTRRVFIAFDSDAATNDGIVAEERKLAAALKARGAVVKVLRLPPGPDEQKVGLDDFLVCHGADALWELMEKAEEPEEPRAEDLKLSAGESIPEFEAERYLSTHHRNGRALLVVFNREFWRWSHGCYRVVDDGVVRADVTRSLNRAYFKVTQSAVNNVMGQLRAQATLFGSIEPPTWLPDSEHPQWDPRELLVTRDKIIHLPTLCSGATDYSIDATPALFTSSALEFSWVDADKCPRPARWLQFLEELWGGDAESIEALQMWFGYVLTADTSLQKMLGLFGPRRSGKGTILRVLQALVGKGNVVSPTLSSLALNFGLWPLIGKTLAIISDARLSGRVDAAVVVERILSITGEDTQTIDRKNLPHVTCRLPTRFMLVSNELPRLTDASGALLSRMIVLRLTRSWYGTEDIHLEQKLAAELPGILWWAIEGWQSLRARGRLLQPASAGEMLEDWEDLASPVQAFVRDRCELGPERHVGRRELYDAFVGWCEENGRKHPPDQAGFGRDLHAALPGLRTTQNRREGRRYVGVDLQQEG